MFGYNTFVGMMKSLGAVKTIALLHMQGTNGGTSFPDANIANTWTPTSVTTSTEQNTINSTSAKFPATGTHKIASNNNISLGSADWTIEFFIYTTVSFSYGLQFYNNDLIFIPNPSSFEVDYNTGDADSVTFSSGAVAANQWNHIAVVKTGTKTFKLFVNGVLKSTQTGGNTFVSPNATFTLQDTSSQLFYMDEFRISNVARYTTNFTPTTVPFVLD